MSCLPGKILAEKEVKVHLGLSHELEFVCEQCGSVFIERGGSPAHLELAETKRPDLPGWKSYAHKNLSIGEWTRIAQGGVSDHEQLEHDLAKVHTDLREGRVSHTSLSGEPPVLLRAERR